MTINWRGLLWAIPVCAALGAIPAVLDVVFNSGDFRQFAESSLRGFVYASSIFIPNRLLFPVLISRLQRRPAGVQIAALAVAAASACVLGCVVSNALFLVTGLIPPGAFGRTVWWTLRICFLITFSGGALTIAIAELVQRLQKAKEALHARELGEERQRKIAAEARFASLESRVHPHFLFNTLNSISALVREDPPEAERMIERLSALLRFSLDSETAGLAPLGEELRVVRDYLDIERVRFGERLRYRINAEESALNRTIPALSVQTLVENSVKYAVGSRAEGAEIAVSASVVNEVLRVDVSDDGPGFDPSTGVKPGHGLDLLERRLTATFGSAASLNISAARGGTTVAIRVQG